MRLIDLYHVAVRKYQRTNQTRDLRQARSIMQYVNSWGEHVWMSDDQYARAEIAKSVSHRTGHSLSHCVHKLESFYKLKESERKYYEPSND